MATKVNEQSAAVKAMSSDWQLTMTLLGGTAAMRAAGQTYLPKWPAEDDAAYKARLATAVLFPAFSRTVETLAAKPFSQAVTVDAGVPESITPLLENIDLEGRNLDTFAAEVMDLAMGPGLCGILVDTPERPEGIKTVAQEQAAGIRPYWVLIRPLQILGWKRQKIKGQWMLSQLRIMECVEEDDDAFGVVEVEQVRVLEPGKWSTYRKGQGQQKDEWLLHAQGVTSLGVVPFVPVYGKRTGFMMAKPPLLEVAHLNVKHWQSQSDQDTILHVARVPILTARQVGDKFELKVGASAAVDLGSGPDAELRYVEHTGKAIEAGKASLDDLKDEMRQAGAELLVIDQTQKTATETRSEDPVGMCALQRIAEGLEDALDQALQLTADYLKAGDGGHVELFDDYGAATLAEASAQILLTANTAGKISDQTLRSELKRRGILSPDVDEEEEQGRLQEQGPALGGMTGGGNGQ